MKYFARFGVEACCAMPQIHGGRLYATVDEIKTLMDMGQRCGVSIDCIEPSVRASPEFLSGNDLRRLAALQRIST